MKFQYDDGGRVKAGFKGSAGDCVARAIAIATGLPYIQIYNRLAAGNASQRRNKKPKKSDGRKSARSGIYVRRKWFQDYMLSLGFYWTPTMHIGSGCTVHLADSEIPDGTLIVSLSRHYSAVIDGVIHDTYDPRREVHCIDPDHGQELKPGQWRVKSGIASIQRRCVYGFWSKKSLSDPPKEISLRT